MSITNIFITTGAESSGKTTLAKDLSEYLQAPCLQEVSRVYLQHMAVKTGTTVYRYEEKDLLAIAHQQHALEQTALINKPAHLICDTDLLVILIWSEVRYGRCHPWIKETLLANQQNPSQRRHYLLCHWDIPWQADPLRENPHNRDLLFNIYLEKLEEFQLPHTMITGKPADRLNQAITHCCR
jgi:nicotinamide riboside kinase